MGVHVATIKEAHRMRGEAFDSALVIFSIPASDKTKEKTYKLEMMNSHFLLEKLFEYTNTESRDINDVVGKSFRAVLGTDKYAIGHLTEDRFVITGQSEEFKLEDLNI